MEDSMREYYDIIIIGGGPAGLAAAVAAFDAGVKDILILERDHELGGILNQCIHNGFGLHTFREELTGPEYAGRYIEKVSERGIPCFLDTMVLDIDSERRVTALNQQEGLFTVQAGAVILAMGCRERSRGALNIPGYRPAGIYSAGTAQRLVNMEGYMPGKEVVILGSGDIGLIMARRMTLEGAKVKVVAELMPYSGGLKRNIVQCLDDYGIPLKLSHTVIDIKGKERVESVTLAKVGKDRRPIPGTEEEYRCDTLLLSVGLVPENELSRQMGVEIGSVTGGPVVNESLETNVPGVFACGNVLHVHDLVDFVSQEAALAGKSAAAYVMEKKGATGQDVAAEQDVAVGQDLAAEQGRTPEYMKYVSVSVGNGVRYTVPAKINPVRMQEKLPLRFRVGEVYRNCYVDVYLDGERILHKKKQVLAPGEMETVTLDKQMLLGRPQLQKIIVRIEQEQEGGVCK